MTRSHGNSKQKKLQVPSPMSHNATTWTWQATTSRRDLLTTMMTTMNVHKCAPWPHHTRTPTLHQECRTTNGRTWQMGTRDASGMFTRRGRSWTLGFFFTFFLLSLLKSILQLIDYVYGMDTTSGQHQHQAAQGSTYHKVHNWTTVGTGVGRRSKRQWNVAWT